MEAAAPAGHTNPEAVQVMEAQGVLRNTARFDHNLGHCFVVGRGSCLQAQG